MLSQNDIDRCMAALSYPVTRYYKGAVVDAAAQLEKFGGLIAEDRVIGYLDAIEKIEVQITTGAAKDGLIQADVLKWSGSRSGGLRRELGRLIDLLAATLDLRPYTAPEGGNILTRS